MTILDMDKAKKLEIEILDEIDKICKKYNLRYSLGYGTLLGAIRHNGFIPWDDDIDIIMPRPDYEKFVKIFNNESTKMELICYETNPNYLDLAAKVYHSETHIYDENIRVTNDDAKIGLFVDVFPIDGLGETKKDACNMYAKSEIKRNILIASTWKKFFFSKTRSWVYEPIRFVLFSLSRILSTKNLVFRILAICKSKEFDNTKYVGVVCSPYKKKDIFDRDIFSNFISIEFENKQYSSIEKYDDYLKQIYGDYMKLPPIENRVTHHTFKAFYKGEEE